MRVFGLGPTEIAIIVILLGLNAIPGFAMYRIAKRAGYIGSSPWLWAVGYVVTGWIALLVFALTEWPAPPSHRLGATVPVPPAPVPPAQEA